MKLLFVQGGSRWKFDTEGNVYTESNFSETVWNRYLSYADELTVVLRREACVYSKQDAEAKFNRFPQEKCRFVALPDVVKPWQHFVSPKVRSEIRNTMEAEVKAADKIIIRSLGNTYTSTAYKMARKHHKPFLVEVTGFAFEGMWYHSLAGKVLAPLYELRNRLWLKRSSWICYVTEREMQKRYPGGGETLGCSDVELQPLDEKALDKRIQRIETHTGKIVLGTAAHVDVKCKEQQLVIRALGQMRKKGIDGYEYQILGNGTGAYLRKEVQKAGVEDCVKFLPPVPHDEVFEWLDQVDIYVSPSDIEGLTRSVVEAMSRACPVICSDVGGNPELTSGDGLFPRGDVRQLMDRILHFSDKGVQKAEAKRAFARAKDFDAVRLNQKRDAFYHRFMEE